MSLAVCHLAIIWPHSLTAEWGGVTREQLGVVLLLLLGVQRVGGSSQIMLIRAMQALAEASVLCSRRGRQ
jgi:hypothetical protein